jgi:hypothetical protein
MNNLTPLELDLERIAGAWYAVEERIAKGRAFVAAHPGDRAAEMLLASLEAESTRLGDEFARANTNYKAVHDLLHPAMALYVQPALRGN